MVPSNEPSLYAKNWPYQTLSLARPARGSRKFRRSASFYRGMGDLIRLADWQAPRTERPGARRPTFYFDLSCPFSYLAAERVERDLGEVYWIPATGLGPADRTPPGFGTAERAAAERIARAHRLPLIWQEGAGGPTPMAMRAAQYATEAGAGAAFARAAGRLAYCGGFPLERPETLAEAAAAAGLE